MIVETFLVIILFIKKSFDFLIKIIYNQTFKYSIINQNYVLYKLVIKVLKKSSHL